MKNDLAKYSLWKEIEHLKNTMDFKLLENKIKTFDDMVKQGLVKSRFQKALNEGKVNIKAEYKDDVLTIHVLEFLGVDVKDNNVVVGGYVLLDILVDDIKIDGSSIICTTDNMLN